MEIRGRDRQFIEAYLSSEVVEPRLHKATFNDKIMSYIFAYGVDIDEIYKIDYSVYDFKSGMYVSIGKYIDGCKITITIKDIAKFKELKRRANRLYDKYAEYITEKRIEKFSTEDKERVNELKDVIFQRAISSEDTKERIENSKMAMQLWGLQNTKVDIGVDIYQVSGKNTLKALAKSNSENTDFDKPDIPLGADVDED